jgi:hypothetical protein
LFSRGEGASELQDAGYAARLLSAKNNIIEADLVLGRDCVMSKTNAKNKKRAKRSLAKTRTAKVPIPEQETKQSLTLPIAQSEIDAIAQSIASGQSEDPAQAMGQLFAMALQELAGQLRGTLQNLSATGDVTSLIPEAAPIIEGVKPYVPAQLGDAMTGVAAKLAEKIDEFSEEVQRKVVEQMSPNTTPPLPTGAEPYSQKLISDETLMQRYHEALRQAPKPINPRRFPYKRSRFAQQALKLDFASEKTKQATKTVEGSKTAQNHKIGSDTTTSKKPALQTNATKSDNGDETTAAQNDELKPKTKKSENNVEAAAPNEVALSQKEPNQADSLISATTKAIEHIAQKSVAKQAAASQELDGAIQEFADSAIPAIEDGASVLQGAVDELAQLFHGVVAEIAHELAQETANETHALANDALVPSAEPEASEEDTAFANAQNFTHDEQKHELDAFLELLNSSCEENDEDEADNDELAQAFSILLSEKKNLEH